jgi:hypothetical protein
MMTPLHRMRIALKRDALSGLKIAVLKKLFPLQAPHFLSGIRA